jgi:phosphoserine phosphatase RsbU/P
MNAAAVALMRQDVLSIILGSVFLSGGLAACGIAAIRGRQVRLLLWQGIFSAMYGLRILAQVPASFQVLPQTMWGERQAVISVITDVILLPALLFWLELSKGQLRRVLQVTVAVGALLAAAGVGTTLIAGRSFPFQPAFNVLVIWAVGLLAVVNGIPGLSRRFLAVQSWLAAAGALIFAIAALYTNVADLTGWAKNQFFEPLALAVFILTLLYVAAEKTFADEKRLLEIESELQIAREIQSSILPRAVPELQKLRISARYRPMAAVAGDFYEFVRVEEHRVGVLVADVTGHGVPAALIASMIKVAAQSIIGCAENPGEVMRGLDRALSGQLQETFVSVAYLWVDTEKMKAWYSAAGHPPLVKSNGRLERIESNGILLGVVPGSEYPVREIACKAGDRFLLYTDGVIEPENDQGQSFGDGKLEEVMKNNAGRAGGALAEEVLAEIRKWQPAGTAQQDDITLIVLDVL